MSRSSLLIVSAALSFSVFPPFTHAEESVTETWRLFVADHSQPVVRSIDLVSGKELGRFELKGYATLARSETGRSVYAVQGDENIVHVIDSGISLSDHGEHRDIKVTEPKLLTATIEGNKPGHVVAHGDDVAVFYDRDNTFSVLSEREILSGKAAARKLDTIAAHHGVAVPMGRYFLVSVPNTEADVKAGELPPRLGLRVVDGAGQQLGDTATCTGLHGEATSARLAAFGCEEGVLVVRPGGIDGPKLEMLSYGDLPEGKVSTLLGGTSMQFFLGNYGEDKLVLIDPDSESEPYRLVELDTRRVDFTLDPAKPSNAYVLTEDGKIHILDIVKGEIVKSATVTEPYSKDGHWRDPRPRLAVAKDSIAITDPRHGLVRVVDSATLTETRTIAVEGLPFSIVSVGGSGATH